MVYHGLCVATSAVLYWHVWQDKQRGPFESPRQHGLSADLASSPKKCRQGRGTSHPYGGDFPQRGVKPRLGIAAHLVAWARYREEALS